MNSLRGRLLLAAGAVLVLFVLITALALEQADYARAVQAQRDRLEGLVYGILSAVEVSDDGDIQVREAALREPRFAQFDSGLGAVITEIDGTVLWRTTSLLRDPRIPLALPIGSWRQTTPTNQYPFFNLALGVAWALENGSRRFTVIVTEDSKAFLAQRSRFRRTLWLWLGTAAMVLLASLVAVLYWGLGPVRKLTREIKVLQAGKQASISEAYPDELRPLGKSLNALISNERLRQSRYRLALDDLAHSLKTPLAALQAEVGDRHECKAPLQQMQQQIDYHLKRAMAGSGRTFGQHTDLAPLAAQIVSALTKVYADKNISFRQKIAPDLQLPVDEGEMMEVLGNLLDNACKWCRHQVTVEAISTDSMIRISIDDDGPGFPQGRHRLLDRGIRADQHKEGQGIGLALVADIVRSLDGHIELGASATLGGAGVQLELPLARAH